MRTERRDSILLVTIDRPKALNAVDQSVADGIEAAVDELESDPDLMVGVLAATGPVGGFAGLVRRSRTKPIIAAVHADALAGGFEIALACDLIVASETAKMGLPEVRWSLVAIGGGLVHLPALVGRKVALELALTGAPIPNTRLHGLGVINRLVPGDQVLDTALELATTIGRNGPLAVAASRRIVMEGLDRGVDERWALSDGIGLPVFATEDAREGPRAFAEKRKPTWRGK